MKNFFRRDFLNLPAHHTLAAIKATISVTHNDNFFGDITISDCFKAISLEFDASSGTYSTEEDLDNLEHKIDLLYEIVRDFRKVLKSNIKQKRKELKEKKPETGGRYGPREGLAPEPEDS